MTPQKRLSLLYQAGFLMQDKLAINAVDRTAMHYFAECVKLLAVQSDGFIANNAESLAEGLGLPLRLFTEAESEATND